MRQSSCAHPTVLRALHRLDERREIRRTSNRSVELVDFPRETFSEALALAEALREPTARAVVERLFHGVVDLLTDPHTPTTCMWVHGALSCGDDPLRKEFAAQRAAGFEQLRARFRRAVAEGDLPINADVDTLASFVQTIVFGLTVEASTGATRKNLLCVVAAALQAWPK